MTPTIPQGATLRLALTLADIDRQLQRDGDKEKAHSAADDAMRAFVTVVGLPECASLHKKLAEWCA